MKLLIADDHTLFRDALVQYVERANPGCTISVTKDFHDAYETLLEDHNYDLVILDLRMPGMVKMDGFKKIREEFPDLKLALMSGVAETSDVTAAMDLGACAYFPKTLSGKKLVLAIQGVLAGEIFVPKEDGSDKIMPSYRADEKRANFSYGGLSEANVTSSNEVTAKKQEHEDELRLTPREKEVLSYLAKGDSNKEIANALGLQVVTVKLHVRGICRKLEANNRTQAALKATQLGLVAVSKSL